MLWLRNSGAAACLVAAAAGGWPAPPLRRGCSRRSLGVIKMRGGSLARLLCAAA